MLIQAVPFGVAAIASPFIGTLSNKINTKVMYILGCLLSGGRFFTCSICKEL